MGWGGEAGGWVSTTSLHPTHLHAQVSNCRPVGWGGEAGGPGFPGPPRSPPTCMRRSLTVGLEDKKQRSVCQGSCVCGREARRWPGWHLHQGGRLPPPLAPRAPLPQPPAHSAPSVGKPAAGASAAAGGMRFLAHGFPTFYKPAGSSLPLAM